MKKMNLISMILLGFAFPLGVQAQWIGNWLLGISGGYVYRNGNFELNIGHPDLGTSSFEGEVTHLYEDLDDSGLIWGILGGYQAFCDRLLVGLELSMNWDNVNELEDFAFTDATGLGWEGAVRYRRQVIYSLVMRLGIIETPFFMPYVRFGGEMSEDQLLYAGATDPSITLSPTLPNSIITEGSRWQYYLVGGIGFEMPMCFLPRLALRMEMNFHSRGKGVDATDFTSDGFTFVRANGRTRSNFAQAAFVWNFI